MAINNSRNQKPSFGTCSRTYEACGREIATYTIAFRPDINWQDFASFLAQRFQNKPKVNVNVLACSDGSEPFTLAIVLRRLLGNASDKFFKIHASDCDKEVLRTPMSGKWNLDVGEAKYLRDYLASAQVPSEIDLDFFAQQTKTYGISSFLKDSVEFKVAKLTDVLPKVASKPDTVIMCRNVLPYLSAEDFSKVLQVLPSVSEGNIFTIGAYDVGKSKIQEHLLQNGFKRLMPNVYQKT